MNKIIVLLTIVLCGCEPYASEQKYQVVPDELKDCKIFSMYGGSPMQLITVVRCPNSQTSTTWQTRTGKTTSTYTSVVL